MVRIVAPADGEVVAWQQDSYDWSWLQVQNCPTTTDEFHADDSSEMLLDESISDSNMSSPQGHRVKLQPSIIESSSIAPSASPSEIACTRICTPKRWVSIKLLGQQASTAPHFCNVRFSLQIPPHRQTQISFLPDDRDFTKPQASVTFKKRKVHVTFSVERPAGRASGCPCSNRTRRQISPLSQARFRLPHEIQQVLMQTTTGSCGIGKPKETKRVAASICTIRAQRQENVSRCLATTGAAAPSLT